MTLFKNARGRMQLKIPKENGLDKLAGEIHGGKRDAKVRYSGTALNLGYSK